MQISIIILVKNEIKNLPKLIGVLSSQKLKDKFEVIVIDSGSTDGSREFIQKRIGNTPFRLRQFLIKECDFNHGETRNFGVSKTKGEIIVFLTADALPASNNWLYELVKPVINDKYPAVFGRQIPYNEATIFDKFFYRQIYPAKNRIITKDRNFSLYNIYFSNVNSAVKAEVFQKIKFRKDCVMSEEQWWAKDFLQKGNTILYNKYAVVNHSHNYNLRKLFMRQFTSAYSLIGFQESNLWDSLKTAVLYILNETVYVIKNGSALDLIKMFIYEPVRFSGFALGSIGKKIPPELARKFLIYNFKGRKK